MAIARPTGSFATGGGGAGAMAAGLLSSGDLDLPQAGVSWVRTDLSVGSAHDRIELGLYRGSRLANAESGSAITVSLGYDGDDTEVLAGEVVGARASPPGPVLVAYSPSRRLSDHRIARTFVRQTVADVVTDLLDDAEVATGDVEAPQTLAAYHVDPKMSVWQHLHRLAKLVGAQVTSRSDGAVSFGPAPGATPAGGLGGLASAASSAASLAGLGGNRGLRSGANILGFQAGPVRAEAAAAVPVFGLGAASGLGPSRWYHVVKAPDSLGGTSDVSPAVRDQDLAEVATTARSDAARRRQRNARVQVPGDPALRAGAEIAIDDVAWRALKVRHLMSTDTGYVCDLVLEGT